jgi:large subunit ribosomal protein L19
MAEAKKHPNLGERWVEYEQTFLRKGALPPFDVGDTVDVMVTIKEGDKERVQVFNGTVIGRRGRGLNEMFTVRRIVQDEGVERTFPVNSPKIAGLEVKRRGKVRRAKLNYLRKRTGKATRLTERMLGQTATGTAAASEPAAAPAPAAAKAAGKEAPTA